MRELCFEDEIVLVKENKREERRARKALEKSKIKKTSKKPHYEGAVDIEEYIDIDPSLRKYL